MNELQVRTIFNGIVTRDIMPEMIEYMRDKLDEFKGEIEEDYYSSKVKFKDDHLTIRTHAEINPMSIRRVKLRLGGGVTFICNVSSVEVQTKNK